MCDVSDGFKLCTCAPGGPTDWTLWRRSQLDGMLVLGQSRGMVIQRTEDEELQALFLQDGLNRGDVFDFEYVPAAHDRIAFRSFGRGDMTFEHDGERWNLLEPQLEGEGLEWHTRHQEGRVGLAELTVDGPIWHALLADPTPEKRKVAMDWLLDAGHDAVARWLQLADRVAAGDEVDRSELLQATRKVGLSVRAALGDGEVRCGKRCPTRWRDLARTDDARVRRCRCGRAWTYVDVRREVHQVVDPAFVTP